MRSIFPDSGNVESSEFDLHPTTPQAEAVCSVVERYFSGRATAFRDRLSFMKKGDFELDWATMTGGVALATLFQGQSPSSVSVLLAGVDPPSDSMMMDVFREQVLTPLFERQFDDVLADIARPLLMEVIMPSSPEWIPAIQLLNVSIASVYFRTVLDRRCPT